MGVNNDANESNTKLNLHESNFILLNTPDKSNAYIHANENVISGYKKMGDKILFYIKLFFKNKNKSHKLHMYTRRHKRHDVTLKHKRYPSKSKVKSSRRIKYNSNSKKGNKTRKNSAFMRV
jgi:hypothetical protein